MLSIICCKYITRNTMITMIFSDFVDGRLISIFLFFSVWAMANYSDFYKDLREILRIFCYRVGMPPPIYFLFKTIRLFH